MLWCDSKRVEMRCSGKFFGTGTHACPISAFQKDRPAFWHQFARWEDSFACEMCDVYRPFFAHGEVSALTAEGLVAKTPWMSWDVGLGEARAK